MDRKSASGSGMNNPDHIFYSLETIFWVKILKFFDEDPGSATLEKSKMGTKLCLKIMNNSNHGITRVGCR
jgi:hypothetical protein